nr:MAG TPA: hypothetical protein [Caudoviricetes sp.]
MRGYISNHSIPYRCHSLCGIFYIKNTERRINKCQK